VAGVFGFIFWLHRAAGAGDLVSYRVIFDGAVSGLRTGGPVLRGIDAEILPGQLVALVGARALAELPALVPELEAAGMRNVHARAVGASLGDAATTVVVMTRGAR